MLIEGTVAGDGDSGVQARRLVAKYPDVAVAAIRKGYSKRKFLGLVCALEGVAGEEVEAFLREVLGGTELEHTLEVADYLNRLGKRDGIELVMRQWADTPFPPADPLLSSFKLRSVLEFLARSGRPEALQALAKDLDLMPAYIREMVINETVRILRPAEKPVPPALQRIAVQLLRERLEDLAESRFSATHNEPDYAFPRLCDRAAESLATWAGDRKVVAIGAPLRQRERQRLTLLNSWRKQQGLATLPLPEPAHVEPIAVRILEPLLTNFLAEKTAAGRANIAKKIEALGPGALPAIRATLTALPADDPASADLKVLAGQVSFVVVAVRFEEEGIAIPNEVRKAVDGYRSKSIPVTVPAMNELVDTALRGLPRRVTARVLIERPDDDTGTVIMVRWSRTNEDTVRRLRSSVVCASREVEAPTHPLANKVQEGPFYRVYDRTKPQPIWPILTTLPTDKEILIRLDFDFGQR